MMTTTETATNDAAHGFIRRRYLAPDATTPAPGSTFTELLGHTMPHAATSWLEPEDRERSKQDHATLVSLASKCTKAHLARLLEGAGHPCVGMLRSKDDLVHAAVALQMGRWWPVMVVA